VKNCAKFVDLEEVLATPLPVQNERWTLVCDFLRDREACTLWCYPKKLVLVEISEMRESLHAESLGIVMERIGQSGVMKVVIYFA
jgi:hypothetical protein